MKRSLSAANVGIALGSYTGGVAIGTFAASSAVITGLIIAVVAGLIICGDLHPGRLGRQLPEASGNCGRDRTRSGDGVTIEPA